MKTATKKPLNRLNMSTMPSNFAKSVQKIHISKADDDKMQAFGWANVAIRVDGEVIQDRQDDIVEIDELENAAYNFVLHYRSGGEMHQKSDVATLIESVVFTKEKMDAMGIPPETIPEAWWIGFQVNDPDVWEKVKDGEYQMFSIEGDAVREQVETVTKSKNHLTFKEKLHILYGTENDSNGVAKGGPGSGRYPKGSGKQAADGGSHKFKQGFSKTNLNNHWYGNKARGIHSHRSEYKGFTKEQYAKRALELIQKPTGKGILGYTNSKGEIIRYDTKSNDFVKGNPSIGIKTMFKPKGKLSYFQRNEKIKKGRWSQYE